MPKAEVRLQRIRAEAAAWLARLRADELTEADRSAFHAWLAEDTDHGTAFEAINSAWESVGAIKHDLRGYRGLKPAGKTRRRILAGSALLLVLAGGTAYWQSAEADVYQTDVGEQRHLVLGEGCQVFLDTDTRLVVQRNSSRLVTLERGCANFRVILDESLPFVVNVGAQKLMTTRANMDVRRYDDRISVFVIEGEATLSKSLDYRVSRLVAGDRIVMTGSKPPVVDRPRTDALLAWHGGQAIFRDDRLADAVAEMNRYSVVKLVVTDPAAGNSRISGVYSVGDNLAFANSISKFLPVHVNYSDNRIEVSTDESR
jgi:transmembrane sensor